MYGPVTSEKERVPKLLRDFAAALAGAGPDENEIVGAAVRSCAELMQARQCSVWLLDPAGEQLVLRAATGHAHITDKDVGHLTYPVANKDKSDCGITLWILVHQVPVSADSYTELKMKPSYRGLYDPNLYGLRTAVPDASPSY